MLSEQQLDFLKSMYAAAKASGHLWPDYAACEAVVETGWGQSGLFLHANNVFGLKQSVETPRYETVRMPTREFLDGAWVTTVANFIQYPDIPSSFTDRMALLQRESAVYPDYAAALVATSGAAFVTAVSRTWSTDPNRAQKVCEIHDAHTDVLQG